MNSRYTSQEQINEIVEAYKGGMEIKELSEVTGKSHQTIRNILEREGIRKVNHRKTEAKVSEVICPTCRAKGHYKGAKFCYKCGADIRTEADILRERLGKLVSDFQFLPDSVRDNAYAVVQDAIVYLRKV